MGKMILCSGHRTDKPYVFTATGNRIYSIEELCYYISSHVYFIDEAMFSDSLFEWIGTELGLKSRADKLKLLKEQKADLKALLAAVLCSADYFTEQEIKSILTTLDELSSISPLKRSCIRAGSYIKDGRYAEASSEYEKILNSDDAVNLTPEEYGDILHDLAVTQVYTIGLKEASETFREAYERNRREESLRQYLYALKLSGNDDLFDSKLSEYQAGEDVCRDILTNLEQLASEAEAGGMDRIRELKRLRSEGRLDEFKQKTEVIIEEWISVIRTL